MHTSRKERAQSGPRLPRHANETEEESGPRLPGPQRGQARAICMKGDEWDTGIPEVESELDGKEKIYEPGYGNAGDSPRGVVDDG